MHFVVDAAGTANDFWGDITVNSLSNPLFGAGSSLPTGISVHSSGFDLSFTPTFTQTYVDRWDFHDGWNYAQVIAPSAIYTSGVTSWQDLITHGSYSFADAQYGSPSVGSWPASNGTVTYSSPNATPVPAPLPILGAVAAFCWSRKLRTRNKEAQHGTAPIAA